MQLDEDLEEVLESDSDTDKDFIKSLVLWNDDHNTFDHVITCLIKYAGKGATEAENIAFIVHTKGRCIIMEGARSELVECYNILRLKNLTVSIE
jgi:ATP-dependent Clp protease adaptor protein ClpS